MRRNTANLPPHIEEMVRTGAKLQEQHNEEASAFQRRITHTTHVFGTPIFFFAITFIIACWVSINFIAFSFHHSALDRPPFAFLQLAVSLLALYMTMLIFSAQQRDEKISVHNQQLTLQVAMLNDQKAAKIIQLLEDLRRDSPFIRDRIDSEAQAMATPTNPQAVSEAIKETQHTITFNDPII